MHSEVIVRTSKSSRLIISNCTVDRAINFNELKGLISDNCKVMIVEEVVQSEYDDTRDLIKGIKDKVSVMFYVPNNEECTCGLADELDYPIYLNKEDLFLGVYKKTGLNIGNSIDVLNKIREIEEQESPFDSEGLFSEVEEDSTVAEEEINGKPEGGMSIKIIKDMQEDNEELVKAVDEARKRIDELTDLNNELIKELDIAKSLYNELISDEEVLINPISYEEYGSYGVKIEELNSKLLKAENEIKDNNNTIRELREENEGYSNKVKELENRIDSGEINREEIEGLQREIGIKNEEIEKKLGRIEQLSVTVEEQKIDIDSKREEISRINKEVSSLLEKIKTLEAVNIADREESDEEIAKIRLELNSTKQELSAIKESKETEIALAVSDKESELGAEREKNRRLKSEIDTVNKRLIDIEGKYNSLISAGGGDIDKVVKRRDELEEANKRLTTSVSELGNSLSLKEKACDELVDKVSSLVESNNTYKKTLDKVAKNGNSDISKVMSIEYSGSAKIVSVLGRGSYGISTTALSIAEQLSEKAKVVYIDLDLVSPNTDSFFDANPYFKVNESNMTSLRVFMEFGADRMVSENAILRGKARYDILTGIYARDNIVLASVNFSNLFSKLSSMYEYIIVDLGKIGCSNIEDSLIHEISKISYRTIVVSVRGAINVSKITRKINKLGLSTDKTMLMFNLSEDESLNDKEIKQIRGYKSAVIPFELTLYGKRRTFKVVPLIKSRFETVMNFVLN